MATGVCRSSTKEWQGPNGVGGTGTGWEGRGGGVVSRNCSYINKKPVEIFEPALMMMKSGGSVEGFGKGGERSIGSAGKTMGELFLNTQQGSEGEPMEL